VDTVVTTAERSELVSDRRPPDQRFQVEPLLRGSVPDIVDIREVKLPGYILVALLRAAGGSITVAAGDGQLEDDEELIQYARQDPFAIIMKIRQMEGQPPDEIKTDIHGNKRHIYNGDLPPQIRHAGMLWRDPEKREVLLEFKDDPAGWYYCPTDKFDVYWRHPRGEKGKEHPYYEGTSDGFLPWNISMGKTPPIDREKYLWRDPDIPVETLLKYHRGDSKSTSGWYVRDPWVRYRDDTGKPTEHHPMFR
jgi:hypothetical protein